jgi:Uma2 family endonuclease
MATVETLLTAEEYLRLPDNGRRTELVRGRLVEMNMPAPRHGFVCANVVRIVGSFVTERDLGRVMSNDAGVVTERDPDTVRGADVSFYSYARLPKGSLPEGYLDVVPEFVFEVMSPFDRRSAILVKVGEYLEADAIAVCVLDPSTASLTVYRNGADAQRLTGDEELTLPDILGGFRVPIRRFSE